MWEWDYEKGWAPKNWCFWTVVLEKTLESPLDCKEIQPVHPKGNRSWVFFGRNDAKAETPVLWPSHEKSWHSRKDSDAGRDWGQEEKGTTEDEIAGWHHWLDGRDSECTPGVGDGQGGLASCNSWGHVSRTRLSDWTELIGSADVYQNYLTVQHLPLPSCAFLTPIWVLFLRTYPPTNFLSQNYDSRNLSRRQICIVENPRMITS